MFQSHCGSLQTDLPHFGIIANQRTSECRGHCLFTWEAYQELPRLLPFPGTSQLTRNLTSPSRKLGDKTEHQNHTFTMANKRYTKLLPRWVRKTYKKLDSHPSESSNANEKHQTADSSADRHPDATSRTLDTSSVTQLGPPPLKPGSEIPFDGTRNPSEQAIGACSFDMPDDSSGSPPVSTSLPHGSSGDPPVEDPGQALPHTQPPPLRVIIVGGGPTGLVLAHALHGAGISYTLLEQAPYIGGTDTPDVIQAHESGTSLLLWPDSARILDQLGLWPRVRQVSCPVRRRTTGSPAAPGEEDNNNDDDGRDVFARSEHEHGRSCLLVGRASLLNVLWDTLPGRGARVRLGKQVVSFETHDAGVRVTCKDGSAYEGSVVVGCDGAHSIVRRGVCELRAERRRERARRRSFGLFGLGGSRGKGAGADRTMAARYYGLVGTGPLLDGMEAGVCYETRCDAIGATLQVFTSEDKV